MSAVADTYTPRLKEQYETEIRPRLKEELGLDSIMQAPRIEKITLNMGVGEAKTESKLLDSAIEELTTIAGQRAQIRRARKSIAQFKVREGMAVGARVTLRGARMYEFLDRLVSIALPRIRDFRGLNPRSLDGRGNFSLGIAHLPGDQLRRHPAGPRPRRDDHDERRERRASPRAAAGPRPALRGRRRREAAVMAKTSLVVKQRRPQKYKVRNYTRCNRCGRPRAVFRKFGLCRICLRELAHQGAIPGMTKSSW